MNKILSYVLGSSLKDTTNGVFRSLGNSKVSYGSRKGEFLSSLLLILNNYIFN